ncbi:MAG: carboxypeptidase regulatory-like domain-containing protein [Sandaracinaceae bacterium]|nr:carboxypeptidase regulatory-like domain-containing protein [Sandaracinaceae bacterium]
MRSLHALCLSILLVASAAAVGSAQAGAVVHVQVTDRTAQPSDASVTLTPREGGPTHDCVTRNGACDITGVPPGSYVVTATPRGEGRSPLPRVVPVPQHVPSIELHVRLL